MRLASFLFPHLFEREVRQKHLRNKPAVKMHRSKSRYLVYRFREKGSWVCIDNHRIGREAMGRTPFEALYRCKAQGGAA